MQEKLEKNGLSEADKAKLNTELNNLTSAASHLQEGVNLMKGELEKAKPDNQVGLQGLRDNALRVEITRRGLLGNLEDLKHKMDNFEDNLHATETAFNNTALEAFVVAKLNKLADEFCTAQKICGSNVGNKVVIVRKMLLDAVASKDLKNNFDTPQATTPAASK